MVINQKRKGNNFEREAAEKLKELLDGNWKRIAGSGALGTNMQEPLLGGDLVGKIDAFPKTFRLEAKVGYGGAKQLTFQKEWLEKIRLEAERTYSIPGVICKFSGAKGENKYFIVLDMEAFTEIILTAEKLRKEVDKLIFEKTTKGKEKNNG